MSSASPVRDGELEADAVCEWVWNCAPKQTLTELLTYRAEEAGDRIAFTFLVDGTGERTLQLSWAELYRDAVAIGAELCRRTNAGDRAILLYPPGLDFIPAFYGCLYGGVVPVPVYPPEPGRVQQTAPRLRVIVEDSRPTVLLTTRLMLTLRDAMIGFEPMLGSIPWIPTDAIEASEQRAVDVATPESTALIQYTSGSTSDPRGVELTHANCLANLRMSFERLRPVGSDCGVSWLPPYHDLGLLGNVLLPVFIGPARPSVLMSPLVFLQRPFRWLAAISKYRGTLSGGPNFAYDLCVDQVSDEQVRELDLSSWSVAVNGAEPVRAETLDRFCEKFAPAGFRREAFAPGFGLAEATLMVSSPLRRGCGPVVAGFDEEALERGRVRASRPGRPIRTLVSAGRPVDALDLRIVDPEGHRPMPAGEVGEIWVRAASVGRGYWNRIGDTRRTFRARLADSGEGPYLRTGDLGFLTTEQDLFITGRIKELMIVSGRNLQPQDVESAIDRCHEGLRPGQCTVFSYERGGAEVVGAVAEIELSKLSERDAIIAAMRNAVALRNRVQLSAICLVAPGTLSKTSSGKKQRIACRRAFLEGSLRSLARWSLEAS